MLMIRCFLLFRKAFKLRAFSYVMTERKCKDCGKIFEDPTKKGRYPKRYCPKCSAQRKKDYENIHLIKSNDCEEF